MTIQANLKRKFDEQSEPKSDIRETTDQRDGSEDLFVAQDNKSSSVCPGNCESDDQAPVTDCDDDSSDSADYDDHNDGYDPTQEKLPRHKAYDPSLEEIKYAIEKELRQYSFFQTVAGNPPCSDMVPLIARFKAALRVPSTKPMVIGLLGAAGAGKSSLINSVLDCPNLAEAGATGSSCTNVVTKFRAAPPNQSENYVAKIKYLNKEQIERLLRQHLADILDFRRINEEDENNIREQRSKMTRDERLELEDKATTAYTTFSALFANLDGFGDPKAIEKSMAQVSEESLTQFLKPLLAHCAHLVGAGAIRRITASSPEYLNTSLRQFTCPNASDSSASQGLSLWPLVAKVSVMLRNWHVLDGLKHVSFADLPGLQDGNLVRIETTKAYLARCDAIWVVCRITRVKDDADVTKMLSDTLERVPDKTALVVTNADTNLNEQLFKSLKKTQSDTKACRICLSEINKMRQQLSIMEKQPRNDKNKVMRKTTFKTKQLLRKTIADKTAEFNRGVMLLRNKDVAEKLEAKFKPKLSHGAQLKVFCVTNELYQTIRDGIQESGGITIADTQIPKLRAYALTIPADDIYLDFKSYVTGPYRDFLEGIRAWTDSTTLHDPKAIIETIREAGKIAITSLREFESNIDAETEERIFSNLAKNATDYTEMASSVAKSWEKLSWATYRNRCKCRGLISSATHSRLSWNEELMEDIKLSMESAWSLLGNRHAMAVGEVKGSIMAHLRVIQNKIKANTKIIDRSNTNLDAEVTNIETLVDQYLTKLSTLVSSIKVRMNLDVHGSMVAKIMQATYEACGSERGTGMMRRMHQTMHDTMNQPGKNSFANKLLRMAIHDYRQGRKEVEGKLPREVSHTFVLLAENVELMSSCKVAYEPEVEDIRDAISQRIAQAWPLYEELMRTFMQLEKSLP